MAYAEKRGKGPRPWRVKYKVPGGEAGESGFETKQAALVWGRDQEAKVRGHTWNDPKAGQITVSQWIDRWKATQDVGLSTTDNREYLIGRFIRPYWGARQLDSLTGEEITVWENGLPAAAAVSHRTAKDARSLLHTILGDAASARPPLIPFNPAVRPRNRGRRTGRRLDRSPQRAWATPLEVLLAAERAALLSGRDDEFTMLVTIGYTGIRWGETIGLERDLLLPTLINVEWQLREIRGRFFRLPPKDDSYRSTNWEPLVPVDLPAFLAELLTAQADKRARQRCGCAREHGGTGRYVFYSPEGGHYRRSNFARRVFRPACDGRYEPAGGRPGRLVVVDATAWPGSPAASWPPTVPGKRFTPPSGRGTPRLVSTGGTGRCPSCGRAVKLRLDGKVVTHETMDKHCPGSGQQPSGDAPLACWLPVKDGLTPHGLRHSHIICTSSLPREGRAFSGVTRRCLTNIRYLCGTSVTLCHVTELTDLPFRAERAVSPLDGSELWVVLDPGFVMHREASDFLRALHGASRSPHTIRAYAGRVAGFLGWCAGRGVEWSSVSLAALARFKHFTEVTPGRGGRLRSGATVNATLTAVCEFLRFCARTGLIDMAVAEQLSEPRWLRFTPPGFDAGESGQFRAVRARALKARAQTPFPEALTDEQAGAVLACCRRPRDQFLVILLRDTGLRIGEALGLRRADMHLLPDSRGLGCTVVGAHVHVRHRANPNGALAKSRFPRTVPASDAVLAAYAGYQYERAALAGEGGTDLVLVNLYHDPLGAPMTYRAAKGRFERLAAGCGFPVRPHMLRPRGHELGPGRGRS